MQFVITGVARSITDQQIADELTRQQVPNSKVVRINSRATNQQTSLVRVFTNSRRTAEQAVAEGVKLGYYVHRCEAPRENPVEVKQCFKCNGYGHLARDCTHEQACARCGQTGHTRDKCKAESPMCSNCGEKHSVKNGGCKTRTKLVDDERQAKYAQMAQTKPTTRAKVEHKMTEVHARCGNIESKWEAKVNEVNAYLMMAIQFLKNHIPGCNLDLAEFNTYLETLGKKVFCMNVSLNRFVQFSPDFNASSVFELIRKN